MAKFITNVLLFSIVLLLFGILISIISLRNNVNRFVDHTISSDSYKEVLETGDHRYDYDYYIPEEYDSYSDDYDYYPVPDQSWDEIYPGYVVEIKPNPMFL